MAKEIKAKASIIKCEWNWTSLLSKCIWHEIVFVYTIFACYVMNKSMAISSLWVLCLSSNICLLLCSFVTKRFNATSIFSLFPGTCVKSTQSIHTNKYLIANIIQNTVLQILSICELVFSLFVPLIFALQERRIFVDIIFRHMKDTLQSNKIDKV